MSAREGRPADAGTVSPVRTAADPAGARPPGATRGLIAMVVATFLWGATFVVIRDTVAAVDPVTLVCARFAGAALLLGAALAVRGVRPGRVALVGGAASGLFMAMGYLFQAIGLTRTSAGTSAFLTSTGTLFAGLVAWPLLGLKPSLGLLAGIGLALAGSALLAAPGRLALRPGETWTLACALAYAVQVCVLARVAPRVDPVALAAVQALTVAALLAPWAWRGAGGLVALAAGARWRVGYLVVAGSVVAPLLQIVAQRTLDPGRVGILFALEPLFALGFALGMGGERFATRWWLGAALILAAVVWVEARAVARTRRSRAAAPAGSRSASG